MTLPEELPPPGIDGTYRGSCTLCLRGTDTVVALEGDGEWNVALLSKMGISFEQALIMVSDVTGCDEGMVPPGRFIVMIKLCRDCGRKTKFQVGPYPGGVPHYSQPHEYMDGQHR